MTRHDSFAPDPHSHEMQRPLRLRDIAMAVAMLPVVAVRGATFLPTLGARWLRRAWQGRATSQSR